MLTRVLAARLPPDQVIAVRVPLREVPADADLQEQVESAIRLSAGVTASWPVLASETGGALPVILLDGFDELLQATGVSQSDYLLKIANFQRRETEQGRAVAVIVTSRITVADRARIPRDSLALRLEPFNDLQVSQWLEVWNLANTPGFAATGIAPFTFTFAWRYKELAMQPLLLMMLAIYDADANGLQEPGAYNLTEGQLYEKLLLRFAYREVTKIGLHNSEAEVAISVENELTRLSIIALSMFNRGAQFATEQEIDNDLVSLLGRKKAALDRTDFRAELGQAERALGRFFFIQRSTANRGGREFSTYEFLHATFAEYLVARLIWKELEHLRRRLELNTHTILDQARFDDSNLCKFMSHSALCIRTPILDFIADAAHNLEIDDRVKMTQLLLTVLSTRMIHEGDSSGGAYSPSATSLVRRRAVYSVNLVLLSMLTCDKLKISQLFPEADNPAREWRRETLLWQSQLKDEEWSSLLESLTVIRKPVLANGGRDAIISRADGRYGEFHSLAWFITDHPEGWEHADTFMSWRPEYSPRAMQRYATVMCSPEADYSMHLLEPIFRAVGDFAAFCTERVGTQGATNANCTDVNWEAQFGVRHLVNVLMVLCEEDPDTRVVAYRRLTDQMLLLEDVSEQSPIWTNSTYERIQILYYGALGSDSDLPPRLLLELTAPLRVSISPARQLVRAMLAALGRDPSADSDLLERLRILFNRFQFDEEMSVEAWICLRELGYLGAADWAWTDAALSACKGLVPARLDAKRPDLAKRLRFAAGRDADEPGIG